MKNITENTNTKKNTKKTAKSTVDKIFSAISLVIVGALLLAAAWLAFDKYVLKSPVPSLFGYSSLTIKTGSMSGTLEIGDIIIIKDTDDYKLGDIVTFLKEGETIPTTHRIINYAAEEGRFITKGDYNNSTDGEKGVAKEEIIGEMVLHLPILGMFVGWVKDGGGLIYVIAVILILGLGSYMLNNEKKMALLKGQNAPAEEKPVEDTPVEEAPATAEEPKTEDTPEEQGKE